jgi:hypothetical protein
MYHNYKTNQNLVSSQFLNVSKAQRDRAPIKNRVDESSIFLIFLSYDVRISNIEFVIRYLTLAAYCI